MAHGDITDGRSGESGTPPRTRAAGPAIEAGRPDSHADTERRLADFARSTADQQRRLAVALAEALGAVKGRLDTLEQQPGGSELSHLEGTLRGLARREDVTALQNTVARLADRPAPTATILPHVQEVASKINALAERIQPSRLDRVSEQLEALTVHLREERVRLASRETERAAAEAAVRRLLEQLHSIEGMPQALASVQTHIATLSKAVETRVGGPDLPAGLVESLQDAVSRLDGGTDASGLAQLRSDIAEIKAAQEAAARQQWEAMRRIEDALAEVRERSAVPAASPHPAVGETPRLAEFRPEPRPQGAAAPPFPTFRLAEAPAEARPLTRPSGRLRPGMLVAGAAALVAAIGLAAAALDGGSGNTKPGAVERSTQTAPAAGQPRQERAVAAVSSGSPALASPGAGTRAAEAGARDPVAAAPSGSPAPANVGVTGAAEVARREQPASAAPDRIAIDELTARLFNSEEIARERTLDAVERRGRTEKPGG